MAQHHQVAACGHKVEVEQELSDAAAEPCVEGRRGRGATSPRPHRPAPPAPASQHAVPSLKPTSRSRQAKSGQGIDGSGHGGHGSMHLSTPPTISPWQHEIEDLQMEKKRGSKGKKGREAHGRKRHGQRQRARMSGSDTAARMSGGSADERRRQRQVLLFFLSVKLLDTRDGSRREGELFLGCRQPRTQMPLRFGSAVRGPCFP